MKKIFLLAASAALILSACSKSDAVDTNLSDSSTSGSISFEQYAGLSSTKANQTFVALTNLPANSNFGVFAYSTGVDDFSDESIPDFMNNQRVNYDGTNFSYSPIKYWPSNQNEKLSFIAYYPYRGSTDYKDETFIHLTSCDLPIFFATIQDDATNHTDLMVSDPILNVNNTYNVANGNKVCFTFRHILTKIRVQAQMAATLDAGTSVKITSVKFKDLKYNGSYEAASNPRTWTVDNSKIKDISATTDDAVLDEDDNPINTFTQEDGTTAKYILSDEDSFLMMPHTTSGASIEIVYEITTSDPSLEGGAYTTTNTAVSSIDDLEWRPNESLAYTLIVSNNKIDVCANIVTWTDAD